MEAVQTALVEVVEWLPLQLTLLAWPQVYCCLAPALSQQVAHMRVTHRHVPILQQNNHRLMVVEASAAVPAAILAPVPLLLLLLLPLSRVCGQGMFPAAPSP
jgi:hypothetical protein